jgi:hypothetical protein
MDERLPVERPIEAQPTRSSRGTTVAKVVVCLSLSALGAGLIWNMGGELISELWKLRADLAEVRDRDPVGYLGISSDMPGVRPDLCVRPDGDRLFLWAGTGVKGQPEWFEVTGVDLPFRQFEFAFGRDRIKAIDYPIYQARDGEVVRRIYPERSVLGLVVGGAARAYPLTVMTKVEVINEMIGDRAIAVTYCPLVGRPAVYERSIDGQVVSLGTSGYCYQKSFVLYDRATDSLWHPGPDGLKAITGPMAGKVLPLLKESIEQTTWGKWRRRHPETQVVVGGDRSRGIPFPAPGTVAARSL